MTCGERVKYLRKEMLKMTADKFGEKLGVGRTAISKIENDERGLTDQMVRAICREFNVNEEWLRTGEGEVLRTLDRDEEIAQIVQTLYKEDKEEEDSFKLRLIRVLCAMEEDDWKFMENLLDDIMAKKKGQAEAQP